MPRAVATTSNAANKVGSDESGSGSAGGNEHKAFRTLLYAAAVNPEPPFLVYMLLYIALVNIDAQGGKSPESCATAKRTLMVSNRMKKRISIIPDSPISYIFVALSESGEGGNVFW